MTDEEKKEWESKFGEGREIRWTGWTGEDGNFDRTHKIVFSHWLDEVVGGFESTKGGTFWAEGGDFDIGEEWETVPVDCASEEMLAFDAKQKSLNHNEGKPRPTLILSDMQKSFNKLLEVRENGCKKYDRLNWSYSIGTDEAEKFLQDNLDSILRHVLARLGGEEIDGESGCSHAAQAAVRLMFDLEYSNV